MTYIHQDTVNVKRKDIQKLTFLSFGRKELDILSGIGQDFHRCCVSAGCCRHTAQKESAPVH